MADVKPTGSRMIAQYQLAVDSTTARWEPGSDDREAIDRALVAEDTCDRTIATRFALSGMAVKRRVK